VGRQVRFYREARTEASLFAAASECGLRIYESGGTSPLASKAAAGSHGQLFFLTSHSGPGAPPSELCIEYSRGPDPFSSRIWFEVPRTGQSSRHQAIVRSFATLSRLVRAGASYHRPSGLWVRAASLPAFEAAWAKHQSELEVLAEANRARAVSQLGARIVKPDGT
jgi:hypothetical protein